MPQYLYCRMEDYRNPSVFPEEGITVYFVEPNEIRRGQIAATGDYHLTMGKNLGYYGPIEIVSEKTFMFGHLADGHWVQTVHSQIINHKTLTPAQRSNALLALRSYQHDQAASLTWPKPESAFDAALRVALNDSKLALVTWGAYKYRPPEMVPEAAPPPKPPVKSREEREAERVSLFRRFYLCDPSDRYEL